MPHKSQEDTDMTFNQAYKQAMERSASFRRHDAHVKEAQAKGEQSSCLSFAIEGEVFYYGFDGVDLHRGKYNKHRAAVLNNRDESLIIL